MSYPSSALVSLPVSLLHRVAIVDSTVDRGALFLAPSLPGIVHVRDVAFVGGVCRTSIVPNALLHLRTSMPVVAGVWFHSPGCSAIRAEVMRLPGAIRDVAITGTSAATGAAITAYLVNNITVSNVAATDATLRSTLVKLTLASHILFEDVLVRNVSAEAVLVADQVDVAMHRVVLQRLRFFLAAMIVSQTVFTSVNCSNDDVASGPPPPGVAAVDPLVCFSFTHSTLTLIGARFANVRTSAPSSSPVYLLSCDAVIVDAEFSNCSAPQVGGAMTVITSTLSVTRTRFDSCFTAAGAGGALSAVSTALDIRDSVFFECRVGTSVDAVYHNGFGGAVDMHSGTVLRAENVLWEGNAAASGGAMRVAASGFADLSSCTFTHNKAVHGGALLALGPSSVAAVESTFTHNRASLGGAVLTTGAGAVFNATRRTVFAHNHASNNGGAVVLTAGSHVVASDTTFTNNSALFSGACYVGDARLTLLPGVLFKRNEASCVAGAVMCSGAASSAAIHPDVQFSDNVDPSGLGADFVCADGCTVELPQLPNSACSGGVLQVVYDSAAAPHSCCGSVLLPCSTLQGALRMFEAVSSTGEILVAPGYHLEVPAGGGTASDSALTVQGADKPLTVRAQVPAPAPRPVLSFGHAQRGLLLKDKASVTVRDLELRDGHSRFGGLVSAVDAGVLEFQNVVLRNSWAPDSGGCMYLEQCGQVLLFNSTLHNCTSGSNGGAVQVYSSGLYLNNVSITDSAGAAGGAVMVRQGTLTTVNTLISRCTASGGGGGVAVSLTSSFIAVSTVITDCTAGTGGGVQVSDFSSASFTGGVLIKRCIATAVLGGGAVNVLR